MDAELRFLSILSAKLMRLMTGVVGAEGCCCIKGSEHAGSSVAEGCDSRILAECVEVFASRSVSSMNASLRSDIFNK